ncbi:hypothetical protein Tco_0584918, partial [Tanacetum coccineum]
YGSCGMSGFEKKYVGKCSVSGCCAQILCVTPPKWVAAEYGLESVTS